MPVFIIDNKVAFDTDMPSLVILGRSTLNIFISAAAARCLMALIDAAGEPVSREELLYAGWGAQGNVVSENSLNQAITQLRKVMKELELSGELIITVPRLGYKISRMFNIERVDKDSGVDLTEHLPAIDHSEIVVDTLNEVSSMRSVPLVRALRKILLPVVLIIASFMLFGLVNKSTVQQIFTQYYTVNYLPLATRFSHLNIFYNQSIAEQSDYLENAVKQLENDKWIKRIVTEDIRFIYINGSYNHDVFSYFLCRKEIEQQENGCEAYTSIQEGI